MHYQVHFLLGDGDGKDWREDIFATPSYFFHILTLFVSYVNYIITMI